MRAGVGAAHTRVMESECVETILLAPLLPVARRRVCVCSTYRLWGVLVYPSV
ncbi:hypothetical protein HMPREF1584_00497 [Gardnerella vaginalis JCP8481A]|nr:hypothetical protein HMPREF1584_00497 [Gardnerella vaginalis JCP8481A]EPI44672.1 hypothetical protein HMPREF1585_00104 [Gardnerella vaginalis JCP8481B]